MRKIHQAHHRPSTRSSTKMKFLALAFLAMILGASAVDSNIDKLEAETVIINPSKAALYSFNSIDSGPKETHYKNYDFKTLANGGCVWVCFTQITNFDFLDLYQKDKTSADQTVIEGQLLSYLSGADKQPGSIVPFEDRYQLGQKEAGAGDLSTPVALENLPAFHACTTVAGGGMHIAFNALGKTNTALKMWVAGTLKQLEGLGGSCPAPTSIVVE